jgi:hypothetical protein
MLDGRDLEIVAALQDDARATFAEVGRRAGLAPSSVEVDNFRDDLVLVLQGHQLAADERRLVGGGDDDAPG